MNNQLCDLMIAILKGRISNIPIMGPFVAEYIGYANSYVYNERMQKWRDSLEDLSTVVCKYFIPICS